MAATGTCPAPPHPPDAGERSGSACSISRLLARAPANASNSDDTGKDDPNRNRGDTLSCLVIRLQGYKPQHAHGAVRSPSSRCPEIVAGRR